MDKIALVSAPWPLFSRPSMQLGALKAYIHSRFPELAVDAHHCYLEIAAAIGYPVYNEISKTTWLAECVYAAALFPERIDRIQSLFDRRARSNDTLRRVDFTTLTRDVIEASQRLLARTAWSAYGLIGVSICLCQLSASLYFIRQIRSAAPSTPLVVGGSMFSRDSAPKLLAAFDAIDFAVIGEGEIPVTELIRHLRRPSPAGVAVSIPGVVSRQEEGGNPTGQRVQMTRIDELPPPDYHDYFAALNRLDPPKRFFATLPVEMSRGCWWQASPSSGCGTGCAFCNLNLQWEGYRTKTARQVAGEVDRLTDTHQTLSVAFVDNVVPVREGKEVFNRLAGLPKDLQLFCELRANTSMRSLARMQSAGVAEVQIGIEALSSGLLKRMNKGASAIQNLEIMKNCEALGLPHRSNLILQFPGSLADEVAETLRCIEFAEPFRPLKCVAFALGFGSPVWRSYQRYGINAIFNHPNWRVLFPKAFHRSVPLMLQGYRGDRQYQQKMWKPVARRVRQWQKNYAALHHDAPSAPILGYRDGGSFIIIRQRRPGYDPLTHRLVGSSRDIYLFCQRHRAIGQILQTFPRLSAENITNFLQTMVEKRLMFTERDRYLSLAVPLRQRR